MTDRRVVITGVGAMTPLGLDLPTTWEGMIAGKSAAVPITRFDVSEHTTKFACEIQNQYDPANYFSKQEQRRLDIYSQLMLIAGEEAMKNSGLEVEKHDVTRMGCILGTGIGGINELEDTKVVFMEKGAGRVSPFFIPKLMSNALAGQAALKFGLQGTCFATSSACASSSHAIGQAFRSIKYGESDMVLSGGAETSTTALALAGFCSLKALSQRNDDPTRASRPFDRDRDGFVMGEGAGALVLEELEFAKARGADIIAEVRGFGSTDDAFHLTAPRDDADGATRAIRLAIRESGLAAEAFDYCNAHGTSTPLNDRVETLALKTAFGDHAKKLQVSSTKSMIGHLLGASGAVELVATAMAIRHGVIPPTINYENPDPELDLDYVPNEAREAQVRAAISNSLGFGGHNACIAIARFEG
ncbi:MAG: beta-ketoacyl-ACP synthase II [Planctomycetes bacterium]|nr:beta-ketoacyl-ACP synthase II [Planctomycetota bacterium]